MATRSSTLAWRIPGTGEPGGLRSMGSLRVGLDWATSFSLFLSCFGKRNGNPLQRSCLENPRDGGAWWAAVSGVAQSRRRLKRLSSSSSSLGLIKLSEDSKPLTFHHYKNHAFNRSRILNSKLLRRIDKHKINPSWMKLFRLKFDANDICS